MSPNLEFFGFTYEDILTIRLNAMTLSCKYCGGIGPAVACIACRILYHLPCGLKNYCITIMSGVFPSYCHQCYVNLFPGMVTFVRDGSCLLCSESFEEINIVHNPKCCKSDANIHVHCLKVRYWYKFFHIFI